MSTPTSITLIEYFERELIPKQLAGLSEGTRGNWANALNQFAQLVGPTTTIAEITDQHLQQFSELLQAKGISRRPARYYADIVLRVLSAADPERFAFLTKRDRYKAKPPLPGESPSLVWYFDNEVLPKWSITRHHADIRRWQIRRVERLVGRKLTLADLSAELLIAARDAMRAAGKSHRMIRECLRLLRRLWRHAHAKALTSGGVPAPAKAGGVKKPDRFANETIPEGQTGLLNYFNDVYFVRVLATRSKSTVKHYLLSLRLFEYSLGRRALLSDLNDDNIARFMALRLSAGLSAHTVNKDRAQVMALANYAAKKRAILEFVDVRTIFAPLDAPTCSRIEQIEKLLKACSESVGMMGGVKASDWWLAFHRVVWDTGERTGATRAIRWEWLDLDRRILRIPAAARKGHKGAVYMLKETTVAALAKIASPERDLVFAMESRASFYGRYTKLLKRAGLPSGRRWKPQCIRRSFASYLEAAGHNATDALQHTSRSITVRNYIDPTIAVKTQASDVLPELKGGDA